MRRPRFVHAWTYLCGLWIGIVLFSSTSLAGEWANAAYREIISRTALPYFLAEKGFHVLLFGILGLVLSRMFRGSLLGSPSFVLLIALAVGVSSEALQAFFPGRDPALRDVIINLCGAILGVGLNALFDARRTTEKVSTQTEVCAASQ